jgi:oxygen-independent coproporphyrinogen-3 oxidase
MQGGHRGNSRGQAGHYETSAFAKDGQRARHNLNYWTFGDYLGIGAGAHGKISFRDRITREERSRKPQTYLRGALAGDAIHESREVAVNELPFEFMLNALRLIEGFPVALFAQRTGLAITAVDKPLRAAESAGLVERDHATIRPTPKGQRFLNDLLEPFLPGTQARTKTIPINIASPGTSRPS